MNQPNNQQFQKTPFQQRSFQQRPFIPPQIRKQAYPNKNIDDVLIKDFFGKLLSGSYSDIKEFFMRNNLPIGHLRDESKNGPLHIILLMDDTKISKVEKLEICKLLVSKGASMNDMNKNDLTPIHLAAMLQYPDILEYFVSKGGNINSLTNMQQNALHLAIKPNISLCPTLGSLPIIPLKDRKYRDVNTITKAISQHLNEFVNNKTDLYMLIAIKNIIDNTTKYISDSTGENFIENKKIKMLPEIKKKLASENTLTNTDKQFKINMLMNDSNKLKDEFNEYYKYVIDAIPFANDEDFIDPLNYFSEKTEDKVIFGNDNIYYKTHFDNAIHKIDKKYDEYILSILNQINDIYDKISDIKEKIDKLHLTNQLIQITSVEDTDIQQTQYIGTHNYLNDATKPEYISKYQLQDIAKNNYKQTDSGINDILLLFLKLLLNQITHKKYDQAAINSSLPNIKLSDKISCKIMLYNTISTLNLNITRVDSDIRIDDVDDINNIRIINTLPGVDPNKINIISGVNALDVDGNFTLDDIDIIYNASDIQIQYINKNAYQINGDNIDVLLILTIDTNTHKYFNTSILYSFFKERFDTFTKYKDIFKHIFQSKNMMNINTIDTNTVANKYNYYSMYNILVLLNSYYCEFIAYLDFIIRTQKTEGYTISNYPKDFLKMAIITKPDEYISNYIIYNSEINIEKLNITINKFVGLLNLHQTMMITYAYTVNLFKNNNILNYELTYIEIFNILKKHAKYTIYGLFNKSMPKIPYIDQNKFNKIDEKFFENAHPIVNDMIFYLDSSYYTKPSDPDYKNDLFHVILAKNNTYEIKYNIGINNKNGRLLLNDNTYNIFGLSQNNNIIIKFPSSLSNKNVVDSSDNPLIDNRYDLETDINQNNNMGLIGVKFDTNTSNIKFNLLDVKSLLFNITDSYIDANTIPKSDYESKYFEILLLLRRLFIKYVLDTKLNNITKKTSSDVIDVGKNLFDYIKENIQLNVPSIQDKDKNNMANKIIAEAVDKIIMTNISSYIEQYANIIMQQILSASPDPIINNINLQIKQENITKLNMANIDDIVLNILENIDKEHINNILDMDFQNMELDIHDLEINQYTYELPQLNYNKEHRIVYFKPDYTTMDLSIIQSDLIQCIMNDPEIIKRLIKLNIFVNQADYWQKTPLIYAIEGKNSTIVNILLDNYPNIFYRNLQTYDIIEQTILLELEHQELLIKDNILKLGENYKQIMYNIFDINLDLKKNIPKYLEIINYLPIYIFNWQLSIPNLINQKLIDLYTTTYKLPKINAATYVSDMAIFNKYNGVITKYNGITSDNPIVDSINLKIKKIDKMIATTSLSDPKLVTAKNKYTTQLATLKGTTIVFYNNISDFVSADNTLSPTNYLLNIQKITTSNSIGIPYTILCNIISEYIKENNSTYSIKNIHLMITSIYTIVLNMLRTYIKQIKISKMYEINKIEIQKYLTNIILLENNLKLICDYLDTRYIYSTIIDNKIIDDIMSNINTVLYITIGNNLTITLKKLVYNHIINTMSIKDIALLNQLFNDFENNKLIKNMIDDYCNLMMPNNLDDNANIEYNTIEKIFEQFRSKIINNNIIIFSASSDFVKNLDTYVLPYYKTLLKNMTEHVKKLILNYIKYIINQYEGIKILRLLLEHLIK